MGKVIASVLALAVVIWVLVSMQGGSNGSPCVEVTTQVGAIQQLQCGGGGDPDDVSKDDDHDVYHPPVRIDPVRP
jgi:hypothetical protein